MGKRSEFERVERDYYQTPEAAVVPLVPFLPEGKFTFAEPCAGDGRLVRHVRKLTDQKAQCLMATDIQPDADWITQSDVFDLDVPNVDMVITNPPWDRRKQTGQILHRMIDLFVREWGKPTWLLFDSDWMQTAQARPYMDILHSCVSIGRVKWIEGSKMTGKDNCQWYLFTPEGPTAEAPQFYGRGILPAAGFGSSYLPRPSLQLAA